MVVLCVYMRNTPLPFLQVLVEVERASSPEQQMGIIESVFREAHSLKGATRAVTLVKIEAACARHDMPAVLVNAQGFLRWLAF